MRKKIFAVIMSVMMMVTFMPAMAFASTSTVEISDHSANFDTVTLKVTEDGKSKTYSGVPTTRVMSADGLIEVTPDMGFYTDTTGMTAPKMYYYDMSAATLGGVFKGSKYSWESLSSIFTSGGYTLYADESDPVSGLFTWKAPEGVEDANGSAPNVSGFLYGAIASIKCPHYYNEDKWYEDQEFTLNVKLSNYVDSSLGTVIKQDGIEVPYRINTPMVGKKITVLAHAADVTEAYFKLGKEYLSYPGSVPSTYQYAYTVYSGAAQELSLDKMPGVTATFKLYNDETNKYEDVANPTVKDAGVYEFTATVTDGKDTENYELTVTVMNPVVEFGFESSVTEIVEGDKYEPTDLVKFNVVYAYETTANANAAVVANKAELMNYLNDVYTIYEENKVLYIEEKENLDWNAIEEKYETLLNNFELLEGQLNTTIQEVKITENDVTACNQTKTFHVKKAKALKSKKTFQLKGDVADHGTLTYIKKSGNSKITVAKDGKVTVKKGLKKGTYTVKIKAKAPKASDIKTLKIKIKK